MQAASRPPRQITAFGMELGLETTSGFPSAGVLVVAVTLKLLSSAGSGWFAGVSEGPQARLVA